MCLYIFFAHIFWAHLYYVFAVINIVSKCIRSLSFLFTNGVVCNNNFDNVLIYIMCTLFLLLFIGLIFLPKVRLSECRIFSNMWPREPQQVLNSDVLCDLFLWFKWILTCIYASTAVTECSPNNNLYMWEKIILSLADYFL